MELPKPQAAGSAEAVVQRQLDAYNARDLEALVAIYAADAEQFEHPSTLLARGSDQIRERFRVRFQEPNLHAHLNRRIVMGDVVVDHETITRTFPEGPGTLELLAIYEVRDGRIARAWFRPGPKALQLRGEGAGGERVGVRGGDRERNGGGRQSAATG